jgi:hypothetical protein
MGQNGRDMSLYVLKSAESELEITLSWQGAWLMPGERIEADLGWCVVPVGQADDLKVVSQTHGTTASTAVLAGGRKGRAYMVTASVQSNLGRTLDRAIVVRIAV